MYSLLLTDNRQGHKNWVTGVKQLLDEYGFGYVWLNPLSVNQNNFCKVFKRRVIDCFMQKWHDEVYNCGVLCSYRHFKNAFEYETYLDVLPFNLVHFISKLRLSSHPLRIETGRYGRARVDRNERHCIFCNESDLEDGYHFICVCTAYNDIRKIYIGKQFYSHPSFFKFCDLMKSVKKTELVNLSKYIKEAFQIRISLVNNDAN